MCAGMTLTLVLLKGLPTRGAAAAYGSYMMVSLATGLLNSWPAPACTNPVFSGQSSHIQGLCSCTFMQASCLAFSYFMLCPVCSDALWRLLRVSP